MHDDWTTSTTPMPRVTKPQFPRKYRGPRRRSPGGSARAMRRSIEWMADAFEPGLNSPPRPWFKLSCVGDERPVVRDYLRQVERTMMAQMQRPFPIITVFA